MFNDAILSGFELYPRWVPPIDSARVATPSFFAF